MKRKGGEGIENGKRGGRARGKGKNHTHKKLTKNTIRNAFKKSQR